MVAGGVGGWGHAWLLGGMHGCQGACMVARCMCGCQGACMVAGEHVWLPGGVCGCWGACVVVRGHAWLPGVCVWLPGLCMVAGRCASLPEGACVIAGGHPWLPEGGVHGCQRGACIQYDEIWSMSRWYTSYWNASLSLIALHCLSLILKKKIKE